MKKKKEKHPGWGGARPGTGPKPKKVHRVPVHVTLKPSTVKKIDSFADRGKLTRSRATEELVLRGFGK